MFTFHFPDIKDCYKLTYNLERETFTFKTYPVVVHFAPITEYLTLSNL